MHGLHPWCRRFESVIAHHCREVNIALGVQTVSAGNRYLTLLKICRKWFRCSGWLCSKFSQGGLEQWVEVTKSPIIAVIRKTRNSSALQIIVCASVWKTIWIIPPKPGDFKRMFESWEICDYGWLCSWEEYWNRQCEWYYCDHAKRWFGNQDPPNYAEEYRIWHRYYKMKWVHFLGQPVRPL